MANRLTKLKFRDGSKYFNAAAIGLVPEEVLKAITAAAKSPVDWDGLVEDVQKQYALLLRTQPECVSVFFNTTAAVQRILLRLRRSVVGLLVLFIFL